MTVSGAGFTGGDACEDELLGHDRHVEFRGFSHPLRTREATVNSRLIGLHTPVTKRGLCSARRKSDESRDLMQQKGGGGLGGFACSGVIGSRGSEWLPSPASGPGREHLRVELEAVVIRDEE